MNWMEVDVVFIIYRVDVGLRGYPIELLKNERELQINTGILTMYIVHRRPRQSAGLVRGSRDTRRSTRGFPAPSHGSRGIWEGFAECPCRSGWSCPELDDGDGIAMDFTAEPRRRVFLARINGLLQVEIGDCLMSENQHVVGQLNIGHWRLDDDLVVIVAVAAGKEEARK
ncbi:MAG: hypothetical protein IPG06_24315 [Haliea sp.]|nr:hypothetical protein [Haliea sp.]